MSLPWIKLATGLPEHPKSDKLADILDEPRAWSHVVELWLWAARVRPSGDLSDLSPKMIARRSGWTGDASAFVAALEGSGFLEGGLLVDWDQWQGAHREKFVRDRERMAATRAEAKAAKSRDSHATKQPNADPPDNRATVAGASQDDSETGQESRDGRATVAGERRGEETRELNTPLTPLAGGTEPDFGSASLTADQILEERPDDGRTFAELALEQWPALDGFEGRPSVQTVVAEALADDRGLRRMGGDVALWLDRKLRAAYDAARISWAYEQNAHSGDPTLSPAARDRRRVAENDQKTRHETARRAMLRPAREGPVDTEPTELSGLIDSLQRGANARDPT